MKNLNSISEIVNDYDSFIVDLWGVIHDGQNLYPGVLETLQQCKKLGKKIVFLSNAPRRASKVKEVLAKLGVAEDMYADALSSGEVAFQILKTVNVGSKYFYIGPEKDRDLMEGSGFTETGVKEADFAIVTGFDKDESRLEEKLPQVNAALREGLKLFCVNPDMIVVRQDGTKCLCAGVIGHYYKEQGGMVEFIGKPYDIVYDHLKHIMGDGKVLAIGDGVETDIKGANNAGIDSVLVLGGILKAEKRSLDEVLAEVGAKPDYLVQDFSWK